MTLSWKWLANMAWRDSRRHRRKLLLFASPLIFGVAALVAIQSLRENIQDSIDDQSKALVGADLLLSSRRPFEGDAKNLLEAIGGEQIREIAFTTMGYSPKSDVGTLVHLRGVEQGFPHFGKMETSPPSAWDPFLKTNTFVLEASLAEQFGIEPGDPLRFGDWESSMAGVIVSSPPRASYFAAFSPQVLMPLAEIEQTGLITARSLVFYRAYIRFANDVDPEEVVRKYEEQFKEARLSWQTPEKQRRDVGKHLDRLYRFLSLVSLASVVLGGIGIASAIHQHVTLRLRSIAILRCLGTPARDAFAIYLIQAITLGVLGCLGGVLIGVGIQASIPALISQLVPLEIAFRLSLPSIAMASGLSLFICVSFAVLPLLKIRHVPPLAAIRAALLNTASSSRDPLARLIGAGLVFVVVGFSIWQQGWHWRSLAMAGGLIAVFLLLFLVARGTVYLSRKCVRAWWPFALRQGLSNLHRPNNQTLAVMVALGLGAFLIVTLILVQNLLLDQIREERLEENGNLVLIDVQPDQAEAVRELLAAQQTRVIQEAPMVSMRIEAIKERLVTDLIKDPNANVPGWTLRRDFRSTYREGLTSSEKLVKGQWIARVADYQFDTPAPVSLEEGMAKDLGLDVGDTFVMDVQGLSMTMEVTSLREVDWASLGLNFFMVFPEGIFEESLAFYVYTAFVEDAARSGRLQTEITKAFPNLSVVDLTLIVKAMQDILDKVAMAIRFMAGFTVLTGILILVATLISGRGERLRQMALLRTLGASDGQVWRILSSEYLALGLLASLVGIGLALLAFWPLATGVFDAPFSVDLRVLIAALGLSSATTLVLGLLLSRGITTAPPLEVLREQDLA